VVTNDPSLNNEAFAEFQFYRANYYRLFPQAPPMYKRANAFLHAVENMTIDIEGIFAGSQRAAFPHSYHHFEGRQSIADCFPENPFFTNKLTEKRFTPEEYKAALDYWTTEDEYAVREKTLLTPAERALFDSMTVMGKRVTGHMIAGYEAILQKGLEAVIEIADAKERQFTGQPKEQFYGAVAISAKAVIEWTNRYANLAEQEAESLANIAPKRAAELREIAKACRKVPAEGASTFYEALQSLWIVHSALMLEQMTPYASSFGRFDQFMYPFYEADIESGTLTREKAKELLIGFYEKTCESNQVSQNLLIGGLKPNPEKPLPEKPTRVDVHQLIEEGFLIDATNELSLLILEAIDESGLPQPSVALRYHEKLPENFYHYALDVAQRRGGIPPMHNDHSVIPAMVRAGYELEDAVDYVIAGCQEPTAIDDNSATTAGRMSLPAIVRGVFVNSTSRTFDDLLLNSKRAISTAINNMVDMEKMYDRMQWELRPVPLLSGLMPHCMETGIDYRAGGTRYNYSGCFGVGLANAANMLAAIKSVVYDQKDISYSDLVSAIENNWHETRNLQEMCLHAPKFGNNDPYVDSIAIELFTHFCDEVAVQLNARGGKWKPGYNTPTIHVLMGEKCPATPDGRMEHEAFAYGTGHMQGTTSSPTGIINSVGSLPQILASHGTDFELSFPPTIVRHPQDRIGIISSLVSTYMQKGGHHLQLHSVAIKDLLDAQKHPEKHTDMLVRVHGFSAYFIRLDTQTQNDIIERLVGGSGI